MSSPPHKIKHQLGCVGSRQKGVPGFIRSPSSNILSFVQEVLERSDLCGGSLTRHSDYPDSHHFLQSARELTAAIWGQELAFALRQVDDVPDNVARESSLKEFGERLKKALRTVWEEPPSDVFELEYARLTISESRN